MQHALVCFNVAGFEQLEGIDGMCERTLVVDVSFRIDLALREKLETGRERAEITA
jgi:hypothetical protein